MIAIEGSVASGKSTLLRALGGKLGLKTYLEPVDDWAPQLKSFYEEPSRGGLPLQLKVLTSFMRAGKEETALLERSPLSSRYIFGAVLRRSNLLTATEMDAYEAIYDALGPLLVDPQLCLYVYTDPSSCLRRANERGRSEEAALTREYLETLHDAHQSLFERRVEGPCSGVYHCKSPCYQLVVWVDGTRSKEEVLRAAETALRYLWSVAVVNDR